jgi:nitrite reductase/ring-hydroxylating ferredoxin subunit
VSWVPTGVALASLPEASLYEALKGVRPVLLVRVDGALFAIAASCPHLGGELADGVLTGRRLQCPLHEATFDVADGSVVTDPFGVTPPEGGVEPVASFPTRVLDGMVEVELPDDAPR